jgi:hypothetical protein
LTKGEIMKTKGYVAIVLGAALMSVFVGGCASFQSSSSGRVGCAPSDVNISSESGLFSKTWTAVCNGKTYYCSGNNEVFALTDVACAKK